MGRINITSDGTRTGTFVTDSETGQAIDGVYSIDIRMSADNTQATATMVFNPGSLILTDIDVA